MSLFRIRNMSGERLFIPPPVGRIVSVVYDEVVNTPSASIDNVDFNLLVAKGLIWVVAAENPRQDDNTEVPTLSMVGTGGSGNLTFKGAWAGPTAYAVNDIVQFGGQSWVALIAGTGVTPVFGSPSWTPLSASMVWRSLWSALTQYHVYDVVTDGTTSWVALTPSLGVVPVAGLNWEAVGGTGSGITVPQHAALDVLLHNLDETHEQVPTFDADGIMTNVSAQALGGGVLIRRLDSMTADADGLITGGRLLQYDGAGAVVQTLTSVVTIAGAVPVKNTVTRT